MNHSLFKVSVSGMNFPMGFSSPDKPQIVHLETSLSSKCTIKLFLKPQDVTGV